MKKALGIVLGILLVGGFALAQPVGPRVTTRVRPVVDDRIVTYDGTTGFYIQDSGFTVADIMATTGSVAQLRADYAITSNNLNTVSNDLAILEISYGFTSNNLDIVSNALDVLETSYGFSSNNLDTVSNALDILEANYDITSNSLDIVSNVVDGILSSNYVTIDDLEVYSEHIFYFSSNAHPHLVTARSLWEYLPTVGFTQTYALVAGTNVLDDWTSTNPITIVPSGPYVIHAHVGFSGVGNPNVSNRWELYVTDGTNTNILAVSDTLALTTTVNPQEPHFHVSTTTLYTTNIWYLGVRTLGIRQGGASANLVFMGGGMVDSHMQTPSLSAAAAVWGSIIGDMSDQTDLNTALTDRFTKAESDARYSTTGEMASVVSDLTTISNDLDTLEAWYAYSSNHIDIISNSLDVLEFSYAYSSNHIDIISNALDVLEFSYAYSSNHIDIISNALDVLEFSYAYSSNHVDNISNALDAVESLYMPIDMRTVTNDIAGGNFDLTGIDLGEMNTCNVPDTFIFDSVTATGANTNLVTFDYNYSGTSQEVVRLTVVVGGLSGVLDNANASIGVLSNSLSSSTSSAGEVTIPTNQGVRVATIVIPVADGWAGNHQICYSGYGRLEGFPLEERYLIVGAESNILYQTSPPSLEMYNPIWKSIVTNLSVGSHTASLGVINHAGYAATNYHQGSIWYYRLPD